ncbi:helical backbone metal receptor [Ardenticatena maritima]|nr:helical backbone metal receptor [Ardenticatena maritima]KPL87732.1 hypothetical protein SE16_09075 [Ardenticatena maritima]
MQLCDVRGKCFAPIQQPERLVSLVPSTTETLFALGLGDALVGYTRFCVHPADRITPDKWIGGTKNPKIERIVALRPQLVLANREENRREDVEALEAAGVPVWVAEPLTVEAAVADIRTLGALLNRRAQAERLAAEIERKVAEARAAQPPPWRFAYVIWREPWMAAGAETFISNLLALVGGVNVFEGRYPAFDWETLRAARPDVVLLASEPYPFREEHAAEVRAALGEGVAVRLVDGELLAWHGVRLREGVPYALQLAQSLAVS